MAKTNQGGRPLKFKSLEELQARIDDYFETEGKEQPTVTGLALHLDTSRKVLVDYEDRDEFSNAIKRAKARVENNLEKSLYGNSVTGLIFNLKNNFGWRDKSEVEVGGGESPLRVLLDAYGITNERGDAEQTDESIPGTPEG